MTFEIIVITVVPAFSVPVNCSAVVPSANVINDPAFTTVGFDDVATTSFVNEVAVILFPYWSKALTLTEKSLTAESSDKTLLSTLYNPATSKPATPDTVETVNVLAATVPVVASNNVTATFSPKANSVSDAPVPAPEALLIVNIPLVAVANPFEAVAIKVGFVDVISSPY